MGIFNFGKKNDKKPDSSTKGVKEEGESEKKSEKNVGAEKKSMKDLYDTGSSKSVKTKKTDDESKASVTKAIKRSRDNSSAYRILVKPLITEKASVMGSLNKYTFAVDTGANKIEIAKAIEDVYGITPTSVNVIKMRGKTVTRGRYTGKRKDWKKAIITLPKGQSIQIYEGI